VYGGLKMMLFLMEGSWMLDWWIPRLGRVCWISNSPMMRRLTYNNVQTVIGRGP